jgi:hypothetical protein
MTAVSLFSISLEEYELNILPIGLRGGGLDEDDSGYDADNDDDNSADSDDDEFYGVEPDDDDGDDRVYETDGHYHESDADSDD